MGGLERIDLARNKVEVKRFCECGNAPSGSTKYGEFLE